jgi:hypothetical protein
VADHEGQVVEGEVGGAAERADHRALLLRRLPGQAVRPGGVVQAIVRAALAPLADGLGADAEAPGQHAAGFVRAGDLGADDRGGAGIGVDLQHGSAPSLRRGPEALEAVGILYDGQPNWVPTMLRDQTNASFTASFSLVDCVWLQATGAAWQGSDEPTMSWQRTVLMECGAWRSGRIGGAARLEALGVNQRRTGTHPDFRSIILIVLGNSAPGWVPTGAGRDPLPPKMACLFSVLPRNRPGSRFGANSQF